MFFFSVWFCFCFYVWKKEWKTWLNLQKNGELVFSFSLCSHLSCSLLYRVMHLLCSVRSQWIFRAIIIFSYFTCVCICVVCLRKPAVNSDDNRVFAVSLHHSLDMYTMSAPSQYFFWTQNSKKKLYAIQKKTKTALTMIWVGVDDTF